MTNNEITSAPGPAEAPVYEIRSDSQDDLAATAGSIPSFRAVCNTLFTKDGWLGDYDYGFLCMPTIPCLGKKSNRQPPFFGLKTKLPVLLAIVMGNASISEHIAPYNTVRIDQKNAHHIYLSLPIQRTTGFQHALAMIAGVVTPVLIMSGPGTGNMNLDMSTRSYMLSASLISSGILSLIQITRFRIFNTKYYIGTGLLSVVGTSFNFVPTFGVSFGVVIIYTKIIRIVSARRLTGFYVFFGYVGYDNSHVPKWTVPHGSCN